MNRVTKALKSIVDRYIIIEDTPAAGGNRVWLKSGCQGDGFCADVVEARDALVEAEELAAREAELRVAVVEQATDIIDRERQDHDIARRQLDEAVALLRARPQTDHEAWQDKCDAFLSRLDRKGVK